MSLVLRMKNQEDATAALTYLSYASSTDGSTLLRWVVYARQLQELEASGWGSWLLDFDPSGNRLLYDAQGRRSA